MKNNNIIERLIMSIILSPDLDVERIDNLTGALGLLFRIVTSPEHEGIASRHFPLLVQAILTDPEGTAQRLINYQSQYWIDPEQDHRRLEPLRQAPITAKNLAQVLATISQVTGVQVINQ
ncbi:hypothetical protein [Shewanella algae]|uniref:Uncharacterized protein n=1 Tax=Shewanella algae TaxID=38313 RepID=A0A379YKY5_9GAMM|nr:hypothetical protein [Shewanella algae]MBO2606930.1 hypothetical protein [Shewanella algae]PST67095.1 hypothetical protein AYI77_10105 [Shewanella algae]SUI46369.1 Uncharacterised protein [Shewanella algae]